jgi:hypothetical protein
MCLRDQIFEFDDHAANCGESSKNGSAHERRRKNLAGTGKAGIKKPDPLFVGPGECP